jgi:hypothetical protein
MHLAQGIATASRPRGRVRVAHLLIAAALVVSHFSLAGSPSREPAQRELVRGCSSAKKPGTMDAFRPYDFDPPAVQWTKTLAGDGEAEGCYVEQTTDGDYTICGTFSGPDGAGYLFVTKLTAETGMQR